MSSQEFLNVTVGISSMVLAVVVSYAVFNLSKTLKKLDTILNRMDNITKDAEEFKDFIKYGAVHLKNLFVKKAGEVLAEAPKKKRLKK